MDRLSSILGVYWLCLALLAFALYLGYRCYQKRQAGTLSLPLAGAAGALGLFALGGLLPALLARLGMADDATWAWWLAGIPLAGLFVMLVVVILSGRWWAKLATGLAAVALLGLGGATLAAAGRGGTDALRLLLRIEFTQPWWLLLLLLVPVVVYWSYRSLAGLGPVRRWLAIGLRSSLIILLTLALAEARLRHSNENLTVLFLLDRSLSVPEEYDTSSESRASRVRDLRWERIRKFINETVEKRGIAHDRDKAGIIVFGRRPRLELPPSDAPRFNFDEVSSTIDNNYTDIGAAIKLALASFPEGSAKRIVLLSDGNENIGNAEEQAKIARQNGVQIDVVPLAAGYRNENEVLVQSVEAPPVTEQSAQLPIRVLLRSYNPRIVEGLLTLKQVVNGEATTVPGSPLRVRLTPGLNSVPFKQTLTKQQQSYTYEAVFHPERVLDGAGDPVENGLVGDRVQNNRATTHVIALGQRRVLLVEPKRGDHQLLVDHLARVGESRFKVHSATPDDLPQNKAELMSFLSNYDCLILANVPASDVAPGAVGDVAPGAITEEQQEVIRSNTYEQGCGLIMIGGPYGFGAGGWQGSPVEKALPVDCDIKSLKIQGKGGLVLIMHASEMAEGNRWQKEIAKLAIKKLSPVDMMGMVYYNGGQHTWHIPFQLVGERRTSMLRQVDKMSPGDMPDVDPALQKAYNALTDPQQELATKHIIFISDGDHWVASPAVLSKLRGAKVTCTTVCVTSHGTLEEQKMGDVAKATGGRFYSVKSPKALPSIYIKETRLVSQSFTYEKKFQPKMEGVLGGPLEGIAAPLPPLYGFVRTTAKQNALVATPIMGPPAGDQEFPVLAYWHYGLGKSVAFTSDARSQTDRKTWDRDWADSQMYEKFWEQIVGWAIRAVETGRLNMTTEYRDGKVKVIVDARDKDNKPITNLTLRGGITTPTGHDAKSDLRFEQKNSGVYEAEFKAEEAGSYFIVAQAVRKSKILKDGKEVEVEEGSDSIRSGVTVPYSPEYADMESNTSLMEKLRQITGGQSIADDDAALAAAAQNGEVFRHVDLPQSKSLQPIWYWLLLITAGLLLFDIGVRRIAIDPTEAATAGQRLWLRLRGRAAPAESTPQYLDRLKSRKARVGESLERTRAAQRFEAGEAATTAAPAGADATTASAPRPQAVRPVPQVAPDKPQEAADYASRLMKAKKKVWEEREKEKGG